MAISSLVIKDVYQEYVDKHGGGRTFFAANHVLMKNLLFNRKLRNKLQPLISSRFSLSRTSSFDYEAAYNSLKNIDVFLQTSQAMSYLSDYFYGNQPMPNEYYATPIFVRENDEKIIDIEQYPEHEDIYFDDKLTKIMLFSRTAFYANKSVKFVDAINEKILEKLGFTNSQNPYDYIALDNFFMSPQYSQYLSAIMLDANSQDRKNAKKAALKNFITAIKNNNFDERFKELIDGDDYTKLENFLTLWTSHQALYSIKNLATIELLKTCIDWNKEVESENQKINYNLHRTENASFSGISFDIPYSNTRLSLHIPTVYLEKNIFPLLAKENIDITSLYTSTPDTGSALILKTLSNVETRNINQAYEEINKQGLQDTSYGHFVSELKTKIDKDVEI